MGIAAGGAHTVVLKTNGSVVAWGNNYYGQTTVPVAAQSNVVAVAAGDFHAVAILGRVVPLQTRHLGNQLILSWPTNAVGFTLQFTLNLTPPATWIDATNTPVLLGGQWTVTNTVSGSGRFYRLTKQ